MTIENNVVRGALVPADSDRDSLGTAGKPFAAVYATAIVTGGTDVFATLTVTGTLTLTGASVVGASFTTPVLGVATGTSLQAIIGNVTPAAGSFTTLSASGAITSTLATGTAPFVVASTTNVANLNASSLSGATFAAPGAIGGGTPAAGSFTTVSGSTSVDTPLHKAGGTSGVAGPTTLTAITSITVKGGIITAISGT